MKATATKLATPILSQANAVGQGFNIFGRYDIEKGSLQALVDSTNAPTQVFTFQGKDYLIPAYINPIENPEGYFFRDFADTREEFQRKISTSAGITGSYAGFSGELKASYANEFQSNTRYSFAYIKQYIPLAYLQLKDSARNYLTQGFKQRVTQLPSSLGQNDNLKPFEEFFQDFGVYYTSSIVIGGSLRFTSAVSRQTQLSVDDLSVAASAQYKAVTETGSFGVDVTGKAFWKNYLEASDDHTYVEAAGGLTEKISALQQAFDPQNPSSTSVDRFTDWAGSIKEAPGVVDFKLSPIWDLCDDKRDLVQQAWQVYGTKMHPSLSIEVKSSRTDDIRTTVRQTPVILLNGNQIKPSAQPTSALGYQVVILDATKLAEPGGVLFNQYFCASSFQDAYVNLYPAIDAALTASGQMNPGNALILASFGLDNNMPPQGDIYGLLQSAGGGDLVANWTKNCNPGSHDNGEFGVGMAATYIFVGGVEAGVGYAVEQHLGGWPNQQDFYDDKAAAFFYREVDTGTYTLGV